MGLDMSLSFSVFCRHPMGLDMSLSVCVCVWSK